MCNERGGIVDDVIVMRSDDGTHFVIVVNASTREKDVAWMREHAPADLDLHDLSDDLALIAVQGPRAADILEPVARVDGNGAGLRDLRPFFATGLSLAGVTDARVQRISRTGYTGEDGFEIYVDSPRAGQVWDAVLEAGVAHGLVPAGLGARDTLRLEAGLRLYGQDMDEDTDPYSCGLGWTVKLDKGDFIGRDALEAVRAAGGPKRKLVGLEMTERGIARDGYRVLALDGKLLGTVASGSPAPFLKKNIALAHLPMEFTAPGTEIAVEIRNQPVKAVVVPTPFYKRQKKQA
jgi:aminomethyltransferase